MGSGAVLLALPVATVPIIIKQAGQAAAGRAYCIEIAQASHGYRAAAGFLDLSAYTMRAGRTGRRRDSLFHAVLYAERPEAKAKSWGEPAYELFNWSYRQLRFVPIAGQGHAGLSTHPQCTPMHGFAGKLPLAP